MIKRRTFGIATGAGLLTSALSPRSAMAQAFPSKPVRIVVPFGASSGGDIVARALSTKLSESLKQPVHVENREGAGGLVGTTYVQRQAADGHTLLMTAPPFTIVPAINESPAYDPTKDFVAVAKLVIVPLPFLVHPALPIHNIEELVAYAKANPGKLTYATSGPGTGSQIEMALLKQAAGIDMLEVPYKLIGQAMTDLLAGSISVFTPPLSTGLPFIKDGRLRPIALVSSVRSPLLPNVPTIPEALKIPGFVSTPNWYGLLAPAGTPPDVVRTLNQQARSAMRTQEIRDTMAAQGAQIVDFTSDEFSDHLRDDYKRYIAAAKSLGLRK